MTESTKHRLLRALCPDVDEVVASLLEDGQSWRQIADRVAGHCGISVSHESLRQWYGQDDAA